MADSALNRSTPDSEDSLSDVATRPNIVPLSQGIPVSARSQLKRGGIRPRTAVRKPRVLKKTRADAPKNAHSNSVTAVSVSHSIAPVVAEPDCRPSVGDRPSSVDASGSNIKTDSEEQTTVTNAALASEPLQSQESKNATSATEEVSSDLLDTNSVVLETSVSPPPADEAPPIPLYDTSVPSTPPRAVNGNSDGDDDNDDEVSPASALLALNAEFEQEGEDISDLIDDILNYDTIDECESMRQMEPRHVSHNRDSEIDICYEIEEMIRELREDREEESMNYDLLDELLHDLGGLDDDEEEIIDEEKKETPTPLLTLPMKREDTPFRQSSRSSPYRRSANTLSYYRNEPAVEGKSAEFVEPDDTEFLSPRSAEIRKRKFPDRPAPPAPARPASGDAFQNLNISPSSLPTPFSSAPPPPSHASSSIKKKRKALVKLRDEQEVFRQQMAAIAKEKELVFGSRTSRSMSVDLRRKHKSVPILPSQCTFIFGIDSNEFRSVRDFRIGEDLPPPPVIGKKWRHRRSKSEEICQTWDVMPMRRLTRAPPPPPRTIRTAKPKDVRASSEPESVSEPTAESRHEQREKWHCRLDGMREGVDYHVSRKSTGTNLYCATPEKLMSLLAYEQVPNMELIDTILFTFHRYTTGYKLLRFLVDRYNFSFSLESVSHCWFHSQEEFGQYVEKWCIPVRLRVVNVVKRWIENRPEDFRNDADLLALLFHFKEGIVASDSRTSKRCVPMLDGAFLAAKLPTYGTVGAISEFHATQQDLETLIVHMMHPVTGVPLFQKKVLFKTTKNCFYGDQAVAWLINMIRSCEQPVCPIPFGGDTALKLPPPPSADEGTLQKYESDTWNAQQYKDAFERGGVSDTRRLSVFGVARGETESNDSSEDTDVTEDCEVEDFHPDSDGTTTMSHPSSHNRNNPTEAVYTEADMDIDFDEDHAVEPVSKIQMHAAVLEKTLFLNPNRTPGAVPIMSTPPVPPPQSKKPKLDKPKSDQKVVKVDKVEKSTKIEQKISKSEQKEKSDQKTKKSGSKRERKETKKDRSERVPEKRRRDSRRTRSHEILNELIEKRFIAELSLSTLTSRSTFKQSSIYHFCFTREEPDINSMCFLDFHPADIAHVLTCDQHARYSSIPLTDFEKKTQGKKSMLLTAFGDHTTKLSNWVGTEIVNTINMKQRLATIRRFIAVGEELEALRNYNTLLAIISGLRSVKAMRQSWKSIGKRYMQTFEDLCSVFSAKDNFAKYRDIRRNVEPPCLPYVGLDLQDLTFIEDGNEDMVPPPSYVTPPEGSPTSLVNYQKMRILSSILGSIRRSQSTDYPSLSPPVPSLQYYLTENLPVLPEKEIRRRARENVGV